MSANLLSISDVSKAFGDRVLLDSVTLGVDAGDKIGLIGANGAGKSTLMRMIAGLEPVDDGILALRSGVSMAFLEQDPPLREDATAREILREPFAPLQAAIDAYSVAAANEDPEAEALLDTIDRLGGWDWEHRIERVADTVGAAEFLDRPIAGMSGGERKRVALARVMLQEPDLLLLDEPTNHLDADTVEWMEGWLDGLSIAVILVTHDRYFLERVATRMVEVRKGALHCYEGSYTDYLMARAVEETLRGRTEGRRLRLLSGELEWARRAPKARTTKNKARLGRLDDVAAEVRTLAAAQGAAEIQFGAPPRLGKTILELVDMRHGMGGQALIGDPEGVRDDAHGISLIVRRGERFGIIGPNGCGKSTLMKLVAGEMEPNAGTLTRGVNTQVAWFDQNRSIIDPMKTVRQTVLPEGGEYVFPGGGERVHVASWLARFNFATESHNTPVSTLSGGERNRLALSRFLLNKANLLLLDEPTNDLDLETLQVLEEALVGFPGCVLVISHDRFFLDKVATSIIAFEKRYTNAPTVTVIEGDYSHYRRTRLKELEAQKTARIKAELNATRAVTGKGGAKTATTPKAKPVKRLTYGELLSLPTLEPAIEVAEAEVERLEAEVADPGAWSEGPKSGMALQKTLDAAKVDLAAQYVHWEELMARGEACGQF